MKYDIASYIGRKPSDHEILRISVSTEIHEGSTAYENI